MIHGRTYPGPPELPIFQSAVRSRQKTSTSVGFADFVVSQTIGQSIPISRGHRLVKGQLLFSTSIQLETRSTTTDYYYNRNLKQAQTNDPAFWGKLDPLPDDVTDIQTTRMFVDCAIGFGQALNPDIRARIVQLRAGNIVLYSSLSGPTAALKSMGFTLYTGSETQMPDPLMESYQGAGNVPAYRGEIYVVFKQLDLMNFGGGFPDIYAVIADSGSAAFAYSEILPANVVDGDRVGFDARSEQAYWLAGGSNLIMFDARKGRLNGSVTLDQALGGLQSNIAIAEWSGLLFGTHPVPYNCTSIHMLDLLTGKVLSTFGFDAPSSTASTYQRFASSVFMITQIVYGGDGKPPITMLVCAGLFGTLGLLRVDTTGALLYCGHVNGTTGAKLGCRGPTFKQMSFVYLANDTEIIEVILSAAIAKRVGTPDMDFPTTTSGKYDPIRYLTIPTGVIVALHHFAPDDSLIVFIKDAVNGDRVVKYDRATKAILWSTAVAHAGANASKLRQLGSIDFGFITWTSTGRVYSIDCVTGEYSGDEGALDPVIGVNNDADYWFDFASGRFVAWSTTHTVAQFVGSGTLGQRLPLATVITELAEFAGLADEDISVDERIEDQIDGLIIQESNGIDFFSLVRDIGTAFGFEVTESGYGIKITKNAVLTGLEEPALILDKSDLSLLAPSPFPVNTNDPFTNAGVVSSRKPDYDIADRIKISYTDIDFDFAPNTVSQVRSKLPFQIRRKGRDVDINIPQIIMQTDEAATLAANLLFANITNRIQHEFRLKPNSARLEPGDVVQLPAADHIIICKLLSITYHFDFSLSCTAEDYLNNTQGHVTPGQKPIVTPPFVPDNATMFVPIDMPEFERNERVEGDKITLFYAIGGFGQEHWVEASVLRSDDGAVYEKVTKIQRATTYGNVVKPLDSIATFSFDETSVMTFYLNERTPSDLVTQTMAQWLANGMPAIVGNQDTWEYISIREFSYNAVTGLFTCNGFLRGLYDTYRNSTKRHSGEFIIFPYLGGGYRRLIEPVASKDHVAFYKGVGTGENSSLARAYQLTLRAEAQRPLSVLNVRAKKNTGDNDIVFTWNRQSILNIGLLDGPDTDYLEFATESYRIDILNGPGGAVVQTATVGTPTYTYTTADQTADAFTPGAINTLSVLVTQLSTEYGDGRSFERLVDIS